eukprot:Hpha_TRINITY_DN34547_c0_g1::TRINITY_DN34547_c0_g1_i1::g.96313::m.96313
MPEGRMTLPDPPANPPKGPGEDPRPPHLAASAGRVDLPPPPIELCPVTGLELVDPFVGGFQDYVLTGMPCYFISHVTKLSSGAKRHPRVLMLSFQRLLLVEDVKRPPGKVVKRFTKTSGITKVTRFTADYQRHQVRIEIPSEYDLILEFEKEENMKKFSTVVDRLRTFQESKLEQKTWKGLGTGTLSKRGHKRKPLYEPPDTKLARARSKSPGSYRGGSNMSDASFASGASPVELKRILGPPADLIPREEPGSPPAASPVAPTSEQTATSPGRAASPPLGTMTGTGVNFGVGPEELEMSPIDEMNACGCDDCIPFKKNLFAGSDKPEHERQVDVLVPVSHAGNRDTDAPDQVLAIIDGELRLCSQQGRTEDRRPVDSVKEISHRPEDGAIQYLFEDDTAWVLQLLSPEKLPVLAEKTQQSHSQRTKRPLAAKEVAPGEKLSQEEVPLSIRSTRPNKRMPPPPPPDSPAPA